MVLYRLHVTSAGAPLDGARLPAGPASAGIDEAGRTMFYGSLVIAGAVVAGIGLVLGSIDERRHDEGTLLWRTFALLSLGGMAGLLLDYRDGPVDWTHLAVYTLLVLAVVRSIRVTFMMRTPPVPNTSST